MVLECAARVDFTGRPAYGATELGSAIAEALQLKHCNAPTIRQILERRRAKIGLPQPLTVPMPASATAAAVRLQPLTDYDLLGRANRSAKPTKETQ